MSDRPWKAAEREAGALIGGRRYPANLGVEVDVESNWAIGQVKHRRRLGLHELEALALEAERQGAQRRKIGMVLVKRRAGRGQRTPWLVVLTEAAFREMSGPLPP